MKYNKGTPDGRKYQSEAKRQKKLVVDLVYPKATAELEKQLACVTDRCNLQVAADSKSKSEISRELKSHANSLLPTLSFGWSQVRRQYGNKTEVHFKSPQHNVEFRSYKGAKSFDDELKIHPKDESDALDNFIRNIGRKKFLCIVCNLGTFKSRETSQEQSVMSNKNDQAEFQSFTDPLSDESSVISTAEGNIVEEDYWEVERIVDQRFCNGRTQYLVRWKGCSSNDDTWEPVEHLCDSACELFSS